MVSDEEAVKRVGLLNEGTTNNGLSKSSTDDNKIPLTTPHQ